MPAEETQVMSYIEKLCVEIGPRLIGSPANQAAADFMRDTFRAAGLEVEEQPYPCTAWEHTSTLLKVDGTPIPAIANAFSLPCNVSAPIIPLCTKAELEKAEITGKIALFYGALANHQLSAKSWFLKSEYDDHIVHLLETKKPAALLAPPASSMDYEQFTEDWELDIPAATVPRASLNAILRKPGTSAHLRIQAQRSPATARNIVARTPAHEIKLVICAHFDTFYGTPGAGDNGASAGALLALAESLKDADLPFQLEFVAFNGEEALPMGDDEYMRRGGEDLGRILLAINMDAMGTLGGTNSVAIYSASDDLRAHVDALVKGYSGMVWVEPWPESNHSSFSMRGVPALAFGGVNTRHLAHTPQDTFETIGAGKVIEVVNIISDIVKSLAGKSLEWTRLPQTE
jgi:aminopeptidase YwaD